MAAALVIPTAALATTVHFFSGTLIPSQGFATTEAHSITYVEVTTDHTACAAITTGIAGYYGYMPGNPNVGLVACTAGSGTNGGHTSGSIQVHGSAVNPNQSTVDSISDSHYDY